METFLDLVAQGSINLNSLITHTFEIGDAEKAYDIVLGKVNEPHIGILLSYPKKENKHISLVNLKSSSPSNINIGFIGAGSFAQSYLIPYAKGEGRSLDTVVTTKGITAKNVAEKFAFNNASSDAKDILSNESINTVFIATPHNSHATYTIQSLQAGKNVFVEKPLAMNYEELEAVKNTYLKNNGKLMIGFNRRFSPVAIKIKEEFKDNGEPKVINIRVNAGFLPKEHWTQNPNIGGGRIVGEMCHFIDLMQFFTDSKPVKVYADCIKTKNESLTPEDNISIVVSFDDGSIGSLIYLGNGDKSLSKELIEIFSGEKVGRIHDFRSGDIHSGNKITKLKLDGKGHKEEVQSFMNSIKSGQDAPISFESIYLTTQVTFKILDSLATGLPQYIS